MSDGQGKTDSKSTKITVLPDPDYLNVVEVVLNKNISHFFQKQVSSPGPFVNTRILSRTSDICNK